MLFLKLALIFAANNHRWAPPGSTALYRQSPGRAKKQYKLHFLFLLSRFKLLLLAFPLPLLCCNWVFFGRTTRACWDTSIWFVIAAWVCAFILNFRIVKTTPIPGTLYRPAEDDNISILPLLSFFPLPFPPPSFLTILSISTEQCEIIPMPLPLHLSATSCPTNKQRTFHSLLTPSATALTSVPLFSPLSFFWHHPPYPQ